tara:strand:+ start:183 stop:1487 length:1305 start_codon:yes stop_codon:yes gene_type:complete
MMFASTPLNTKELQVKLELEDVLEQTLTSSISDILKYDRSQFAVDVKIDLSTKTAAGTVQSQPAGALQLEGILPTLPKKSENKAALANNEYTTTLKEVLVYIDSDLYTINASTKIKQHLMTMDWMCEDCILIERQNFPNNKVAPNPNEPANNVVEPPPSVSTPLPDNIINEVDSEDLAFIEDQIEAMQEALDNYDAKINAKNSTIAELQEQLEGLREKSSQEQTDFYDRQIQSLENQITAREQEVQDLQNRMWEQNSKTADQNAELLKMTTQELAGVSKLSIETNSKTTDKNMEYNSQNNKYLTYVLFILIGIVILLVILSFLNKGPRTVYLKPKKTKASNEESPTDSTTTATASASDALEAQTTSTIIPPQPALSTTGAFEDGSVLQSDLKSIKQSAVKMSVGQKQGASQIVKDWLDDSSENDDQNNNDQTEE